MGAEEKNYERRLYEAVDRMGGLCIKNTPFGHKNLPDRTIYLPGGKAILVEVKSVGEKPNPKQQIVIERFKRMNFIVLTINSEETLKNALLIISNNIL